MAALLLGTVCPTSSSADDIHSCDHSRHRIGNTLPVIRLKSTFAPFCDNSAFAVISEIGLRDVRFNATYGQSFCQNLKAKVTGEYLMQKLDYGFSTGKARRWMRQMAIGGDALYELCDCFVNDVHARAYYSFSPSHRLHTITCSDTDFRVVRRITGSHAYGFLAGTSINPWNCAYLGLNLNYDHVTYTRKFHARKGTSGLGAGFEFRQSLFQHFTFNAKGELRKPFNFIGGSIDWNKSFCSGLFSAGFFGNYTRGKKHLPNVTVYGIQLGFNFAAKNVYDYNDCCETVCCSPCDSNDLIAYVQDPAVYMPVVLAIAEESTCRGPSTVGAAIGNQTLVFGNVRHINLNDYFSNGNGGAISYTTTVVAVQPLPIPPFPPYSPAQLAGMTASSGIFVNTSNNGIMTIDNTRTSPHLSPLLVPAPILYNVTVTAVTQCGTVSETFTVLLLPQPT